MNHVMHSIVQPHVFHQFLKCWSMMKKIQGLRGLWNSMSFYHRAQTRNIQMVPVFPNNNLSISSVIAVAWMQGQLLLSRVCVNGGIVMLWYPFPFLFAQVGWRKCWRRQIGYAQGTRWKKTTKAHICYGHKRRTSAKWMNKRETAGGLWIERGNVWVYMCMSVACLMKSSSHFGTVAL